MDAWRICRDAYQPLDGEGARLNGGRWNSVGVPLVYLSTSLSLAALELLVHVEPLLAPADLVAMKLDVPAVASLSAYVPVEKLPADWREYPAPSWEAELGDEFVADGKFLWLGVPSAIITEEFNVLLNPAHPDARQVKVLSVDPFRFDHRLA